MYFWRTRTLAEDLRAGRVSERQRMWYLFSQTVLFSILASATSGLGEVRSPLYTAAECAAWATINAVGVLLCFEANRRGDDREFLNRFVCLSWPVTIRVLALALLMLPLGVVLAVVFPGAPPQVAGATWVPVQLGSDGSPEIERVVLGLGFALTAVYYWRMRTHLRWIAAASFQ